MNAPAPPSHHRYWPWLLGLVLSPFVALAIVTVGAFRLNREAAALRREIVSATGGGWHTKIQFSVGPAILGAVRACVACIHDVPPEARAALRSVRFASVGVYERSAAVELAQCDGLLAEADRLMARRGWTRIVGVIDAKDTVLIYLPVNEQQAEPSRLCLAVYSGRELVLVSAGFDGHELAELALREMSRYSGTKL
jgi:hypothetical protein